MKQRAGLSEAAGLVSSILQDFLTGTPPLEYAYSNNRINK